MAVRALRHSLPMTLPRKPKTVRSGERDESDLAGLAGLEAHGGAGGDVEAQAAGLLAVEFEGAVGLGEMVVRADLDRSVAGVGDESVTVLRPALSSISPP